jgi:hypothetical protein
MENGKEELNENNDKTKSRKTPPMVSPPYRGGGV